MDKVLFWAGFLSGRHKDIFTGVAYLRPLCNETLERMKDKARRNGDAVLEMLLDKLKTIQHDDSTLSVFLSGRSFYIRNQEHNVGSAIINPSRKDLRIILDHVAYSDQDWWGFVKIDNAYIFVSNNEIPNYASFFDRTFETFEPIEVSDIL